MGMRHRARLAELGPELPTVSALAASYIPTASAAGLLFVAGQVPQRASAAVYAGRIDLELIVVEGREAARLCALNILAQLDVALGTELDKLRACLKVGGFVRYDQDFSDHSEVLNGASDLLVAALGDCGRHARTSVVVSSLPRGSAVEGDAVFAVAS